MKIYVTEMRLSYIWQKVKDLQKVCVIRKRYLTATANSQYKDQSAHSHSLVRYLSAHCIAVQQTTDCECKLGNSQADQGIFCLLAIQNDHFFL